MGFHMCHQCDVKKLQIDSRIPHFIDGMNELDEYRTGLHGKREKRRRAHK